ncbi:MAG: helix-hairpin-helix domain-containing protein [Deltaproteobacteria bacterium]|nr:helix-hairpin-helix domain-containing protein [Deltaproteobacteria bacterium]
MSYDPKLAHRFVTLLAGARNWAEVRHAVAPVLDHLAEQPGGVKPEQAARLLFSVRGRARDVLKASERNVFPRLVAATEADRPPLLRLWAELGRWLRRAPWTNRPALLVPIRLETRFVDDVLRVRFYPDQIAIDSHQEGLTGDEWEAAVTFANADSSRSAWRLLSSRFGPRRAAWLADWVKTHTEAPDQFASSNWTRAPRIVALPERFCVYGYRDGELVVEAMANPLRQNRSVLASPAPADPGSENEGLFDENSRWVVDFQAAVRDGFALELPLTHEDRTLGFDRLVAVGVRWSSAEEGAATVEKLFRAHRFSTGLGFVEPGTATNNTVRDPAGFSSRPDHEAEYEVQLRGPSNWQAQSNGEGRTSAHRLARALGIDAQVLRFLEGAGSTTDSYAREMNTLTWSVSGDHYLRHLMSGATNEGLLDYVARHNASFVRGAGPLPTIRVGKQPYGVLPVTRVRPGAWTPWSHDAAADLHRDKRLHAVVTKLFEYWLSCAGNTNCVPRVRPDDPDPDRTLLSVLAMQPRTSGYRARTFVSESFVAWLLIALRDYAFGEGSAYEGARSPLEWVEEWQIVWRSYQSRVADLLGRFADEDPAGFANTPLLGILAWFDASERVPPVATEVGGESSNPSRYLEELCTGHTTSADTLLAQVARVALRNGSSNPAVRRALCALGATGVLDFFNEVTEPERIVERIQDDPNRHPERDGYGVRLDVARRILERREQLGRFESIEQLDEIKGVGPDTLHDILYSFRDHESDLDLDRLFRDSLDLASHRVDAWVTSFATKRLEGMREQEGGEMGVHLGAYGFVEDLRPKDDQGQSEGYIHAPSGGHAAACAVLHNAFLTHEAEPSDGSSPAPNPFAVSLSSTRVRSAKRLLEGVRQGQSLGALIGYQIERDLKDSPEWLAQHLDELRELFPIVAHKITPASGASVEAVAARSVVDGVAAVRAYRELRPLLPQLPPATSALGKLIRGLSEDEARGVVRAMEQAHDAVDALSDALMFEGVYQAVQGNFESSAAALEAAAGNQSPPELPSLDTPVAGRTYTHRAAMLLNESLTFSDEDARLRDPRGGAEPRVAAWCQSLFGPLENIGVGFEFWEPISDPEGQGRLDVNRATQDELVGLDGIGPQLAVAIVQDREGPGGPFRTLADLQRVSGIGPAIVDGLRATATTGFVERIDINSASEDLLQSLPGIGPALAAATVAARPFASVEQLTVVSGIDAGMLDGWRPRLVAIRANVNRATLSELEALEGIGPVLAHRIVQQRELRPFDSVDDLRRVEGIDDGVLDPLRDSVTTDFGVLGVEELGLNATDLFYGIGGAAGPEGVGERVARRVREIHALAPEVPVEIRAWGSGSRAHSLANAAHLAQQALRVLTAGRPFSSHTLCHPANATGEGYSASDVARLRDRVVLAQEDCRSLVAGLESPGGESGADLLSRATRYGVIGVEPAGPGDTREEERLAEAHRELAKRLAASAEQMPTPESATSLQVSKLIKAMRELFGQSFVVLPTVEPHHAADLEAALTNDSLRGGGSRACVSGGSSARRSAGQWARWKTSRCSTMPGPTTSVPAADRPSIFGWRSSHMSQVARGSACRTMSERERSPIPPGAALPSPPCSPFTARCRPSTIPTDRLPSRASSSTSGRSPFPHEKPIPASRSTTMHPALKRPRHCSWHSRRRWACAQPSGPPKPWPRSSATRSI